MRPSTSKRYSTAFEICVTSVVSSRYVTATVVSVAMGWKVAWSDRMISFYTMVPVFGLLVYGCGSSMRPISLRLLGFMLLPLVLDGLTHMLNDVFAGFSGTGFRDTNLWLAWLTHGAFPGFYAGDQLGTFNGSLRLLTGLLAAWGVAAYLVPWLDRLLREEAARG